MENMDLAVVMVKILTIYHDYFEISAMVMVKNV